MRPILAVVCDLRHVPGGLYFRGPRPGPDWHAHGTTKKTLRFHRDDGDPTDIVLHKQRWKHVATGQTRHDRPLFEVAWSRSDFALIAVALAAWLLGDRGLHGIHWPWSDDDRPSRRTAQRWLRRLRDDAHDWLVAIRVALIDLLAPRPLEEVLPTAGIPPPGGCAVRNQRSAHEVWPLRSGLWLCTEGARALGIPVRTLLVEARRRWTTDLTGTSTLSS